MLDVSIKTIPHGQHRYPTVGDWFFDDSSGKLTIRVSKMDDWRYEFLVALHEFIEASVCKWNGISQQAVDEFDMEFEKHRTADSPDEPGDDPLAPYHEAHRIASGVETLIAVFLFVDWSDYEQTIENL